MISRGPFSTLWLCGPSLVLEPSENSHTLILSATNLMWALYLKWLEAHSGEELCCCTLWCPFVKYWGQCGRLGWGWVWVPASRCSICFSLHLVRANFLPWERGHTCIEHSCGRADVWLFGGCCCSNSFSPFLTGGRRAAKWAHHVAKV